MFYNVLISLKDYTPSETEVKTARRIIDGRFVSAEHFTQLYFTRSTATDVRAYTELYNTIPETK